MLWFLQGQSSQRDVIAGAREALPRSALIYASHGQSRPEITDLADVSWVEPDEHESKVAWVLDRAKTHRISVVVAGRTLQLYEGSRGEFEAAGIQLVTGALSVPAIEAMDDKSEFTRSATAAGLACIPAVTVNNANELAAAYDELSAKGPVCIKPARGIYGQGFWRLSQEIDPFRLLANPDAHEANFNTFLDLYRVSKNPKPLLLMPYMPGSECSIDMVCEAGVAVAMVGRRKLGLTQHLTLEGAAIALAVAAAKHFGCDGIVNVQTRDDADGIPHLLEINARYSGGIGYTRHSGINLAGIFATRRLGFPEPVAQWKEGVCVKAISVAIPVA